MQAPRPRWIFRYRPVLQTDRNGNTLAYDRDPATGKLLKTADVQSDRIGAARLLSERFACTVVLKGSGTVVAAPGQVPAINLTGNARLATAGSGDVLAGMIGAELASNAGPFPAACSAVYRHGQAADQWPEAYGLVASELARLDTRPQRRGPVT